MIEMLAKVLYLIPFVVGYFAVDRLIARWRTGSWWKQPSDVEPEELDT